MKFTLHILKNYVILSGLGDFGSCLFVTKEVI